MNEELKLKTLSLFDWSKLEHAYGEAVNAPLELEKLASEDKEIRREGLDELSFTIYHQGSIYSSSVAAMTVLHEILRLERPKEKHETFEMLALLVSGTSYHDAHQHLGFLSEDAKSEEWQNAIKEELTWVEAIRKSAHENIDLYLSFLPNDLPENRLWASHLLVYLQSSKEKSFPQIIKAIENEKDEVVKANLYVTAECLAGKDEAGFFAKALDHETDSLCKMLALRAHLLFSNENPAKEEAEELLELLFQADEKIIARYNELPTAGDFHETFTTPLMRSKKVDSEKLLIWYLKQASHKKGFSDDFARGLLNVAFGGVPEPALEAKDLTALQREAVILVARQAFPNPKTTISWISDVLEYFKFPGSYEKMSRFLEEDLYGANKLRSFLKRLLQS